MNVIHLISGGDVGGAKTHVHTLLAGLTKTDRVLLVCFTEGDFAAEARALGIPTQVVTGNLRTTLSTLVRLIREGQFEIIHCHGSRANLMGRLLKPKLRLPTVSTVHSDPKLDYLGRPLAAMTFGVINRLCLRKLDHWIGVSELTVDMLHSRGYDPNHTFVIFNGVPFPVPPASMTRGAFLESVGLDDAPDRVVFGIAARINPIKDMGTLVRAFAGAVKRCPAARLVIAGDGSQKAEIEVLAAELCPAGTVAFAGWLQDTDSFFEALDVNLLTSLSEGLPYALPEGASHHCATIATNVGGIPTLVEHEVNGLLFRPRDVETLTEYMVRLCEDPELRRTYADRLYEKTREKFSVDATVARQREIYETILRRTARAKARPRDGILINGAYGKGNSGDDSILNVTVCHLRALDPDMPVYVTSHAPRQTAHDLRVGTVHPFILPPLFRRMKQTALFLSGGGSLIQDATSTRSLWYYLFAIHAAKRRGNKVMMFSCGIGPVRRKLNRKLTARTIRHCVDAITLRDSGSVRELEDMKLHVPTKVTADMAFLMEPAGAEAFSTFAEEAGLDAGQPYLVLAPRPWPGYEPQTRSFAAAAIHAAKTHGLTPMLLAMEPGKDLPLCRQLEALISEQVPCRVLAAPEDTALTFALIGHAAGVLGMRLHSLVFAAAQGVPFAGVSYDPKVRNFLEYLGQGECCELAEADGALLSGLVDRMLAQPEAFAHAAARLRGLAEENCEIAYSLLNA